MVRPPGRLNAASGQTTSLLLAHLDALTLQLPEIEPFWAIVRLMCMVVPIAPMREFGSSEEAGSED